MKQHSINPLDYRTPGHPINPIFLSRWSARAMSGEPIDHELLLRCFEAARWAPSASNCQERLFLYAHRDTPAFAQFFSLLAEGNQAWCHRAAVLIVALSDTLDSAGRPIRSHAFDTGLAVENLLLQACELGLVAHPMAGFSSERAISELNIPQRYLPQCMIAIGVPGDVNELSEFNQSRELPSQRKPMEEVTRASGFEPQN